MINSYTNSIHERGAALLLFVVLFVFTSLSLVLSLAYGAYTDQIAYRSLESSKKSLVAAEAAIEDAIYRHRDGDDYDNIESYVSGDTTVTIDRVASSDTFTLTAVANTNGAIRKTETEIQLGTGVGFNFGLQSGTGGITLSNNSSVQGNVYSNGVVTGQGNATVYGDAISSGATGRLDSVTLTGSGRAHFLEDSTIGGDAYYYNAASRVNTTVAGISYPNSADQPAVALPITDTMVQNWKDNIVTTGTTITSADPRCAGGTYVINTNTTLNNVRIQCNVEMKKQGASTDITIAGPVWIEGNLDFSSGPSIIASPALGSKSVAIIVDKESNRTTSSKIRVNQSTNFTSSNASSYILLLSMNNSAALGGVEKAIDVGQSANGKVLVYAGYGLVDLGNSISLKEVTAHQIDISNGASVIYESGLLSLLFTTGPGGGYVINRWEEVE